MAKTGMALKQVKNQAAQAAGIATANPWLERLVRLGYAVRGVLYAVVGLLAVQVALGAGGATTDKNGALTKIGSEPFGKFLLIVVVVGLAGYAIWGFIRAILDPQHRGTDPKGVAQRVGYAVSGLSYGALVIPTARMITSGGGAGANNGSADLTARMLALPLGQWLVALLGFIIMAGGLGQLAQAATAGFKKDFKEGEKSPNEMTWAVRIGRFGLAARGIVFLMLGFFVLQAALHVDPKQAKGMDAALATLAHQPHGPWVLGIVALGLVAFGVYSMLCARWIRTR